MVKLENDSVNVLKKLLLRLYKSEIRVVNPKRLGQVEWFEIDAFEKEFLQLKGELQYPEKSSTVQMLNGLLQSHKELRNGMVHIFDLLLERIESQGTVKHQEEYAPKRQEYSLPPIQEHTQKQKEPPKEEPSKTESEPEKSFKEVSEEDLFQ